MTDKETEERNDVVWRYQSKFANKELSFWCLVKFKILYAMWRLPEDVPYTEWVIVHKYVQYKDYDKWKSLVKERVMNWYMQKSTMWTTKWIIIGHPLRRWDMVQNVFTLFDEEIHWPLLERIWFAMWSNLLLTKTIYERVENELVRNLLIELKELIESE